MARKQRDENAEPIKTRLTRLPLSEEEAADLVALVFRIADEERAEREKETDSTHDAA